MITYVVFRNEESPKPQPYRPICAHSVPFTRHAGQPSARYAPTDSCALPRVVRPPVERGETRQRIHPSLWLKEARSRRFIPGYDAESSRSWLPLPAAILARRAIHDPFERRAERLLGFIAERQSDRCKQLTRRGQLVGRLHHAPAGQIFLWRPLCVRDRRGVPAPNRPLHYPDDRYFLQRPAILNAAAAL